MQGSYCMSIHVTIVLEILLYVNSCHNRTSDPHLSTNTIRLKFPRNHTKESSCPARNLTIHRSRTFLWITRSIAYLTQNLDDQWDTWIIPSVLTTLKSKKVENPVTRCPCEEGRHHLPQESSRMSSLADVYHTSHIGISDEPQNLDGYQNDSSITLHLATWGKLMFCVFEFQMLGFSTFYFLLHSSHP